MPISPVPSNETTCADLEITGWQNYGSEYMTGSFGIAGIAPYVGTTDGNNYYVGAMQTIMPGWNTNGDVWEVIRVMRDHGDQTATQAVYIGKVTDATLVRVTAPVCTIAAGASFPAMNYCGIVGKNFNRQLASTDVFSQLNVSDLGLADITDPAFVWPSQIQVADRI